jgi:hypothetical protein
LFSLSSTHLPPLFRSIVTALGLAAAGGGTMSAAFFHQPTGGIHHRYQLDRLSQSPRPDLPTGSTAGASWEATGDSLHLALVLRESRLGELAITLTELALRERDIRNFDG